MLKKVRLYLRFFVPFFCFWCLYIVVHFLDLMYVSGFLFFIYEFMIGGFFILFHYLLLFIRYGLPYFLIIFCINVFFGKLYIYKKTYKKTHYRFLEQKQLYYSLFLIKKYNYSIFLLLNLISYLILFYFDLLQSISILIVFFLFFIFLIINVFLKNNYLRSLGTSSRATFTLFINLIVICVCAFYINVVGLIINQVIELHLNLSNYLYDVSYIKNNFLKWAFRKNAHTTWWARFVYTFKSKQASTYYTGLKKSGMYNNILNTVNYTNKHMQLSGSYDSLLNNKNILELHIGNNHANLLNQAYNTYYSSFDTVWNEKKKNKWVHHLVDLQLKESDSLLISYLLKTYRVNGLFYAFEGEKLHKTRMLPMAYAKKQIPSLRILLQKKANYVPNVSIDMLDNIAWKQSKATQQNLVILTLCKLYWDSFKSLYNITVYKYIDKPAFTSFNYTIKIYKQIWYALVDNKEYININAYYDNITRSFKRMWKSWNLKWSVFYYNKSMWYTFYWEKLYSFKFEVVLPDTTYKVNKPYNVILEKDKINKSAFRIMERAPLYLLLYFNKPQPYGRFWYNYNTHTVLFKHNYTLKKHPFFFTWKASAWPSSANSSLHFTTYKKTTKILNSKLFLITKKEDIFLSFFYKDPLYVLHVFSGSHHNTLNSYFVNKEILTNDNNDSILHALKKMRFSMDCLSVYESAHRVLYIDAYNRLKRTITVLNRFNIFNKLKATTAYSGMCYKQDLQWSQYVAQYVAKVKQWTLRLSQTYIICRNHQQKQQQSTLLFNCWRNDLNINTKQRFTELFTVNYQSVVKSQGLVSRFFSSSSIKECAHVKLLCDFGYIIARGNATLEDSYLYQLTKSKKTLRYIPMMRSIMVHNRAFVCALAYDTSNFFKVAKLCDAFNNDFNFILDGSIKRIRQDPEQDFNSVLNNYFFNMRNRIDFFGYITFAKSHQYISHLLLLDFNCGFTFYVDKVDRLEAYSQGFTDLSDSFLEEENADFIDYMYSEATNYISVYDTIALLDVFSKTSDLIKIQESLTYDYNISTECIALQYNKHMYMLSKVMEYLYLYFYYEMEVHSRYASDLIDSYIDNDPKLHYLIALIDIVYEYSEDQWHFKQYKKSMLQEAGAASSNTDSDEDSDSYQELEDFNTLYKYNEASRDYRGHYARIATIMKNLEIRDAEVAYRLGGALQWQLNDYLSTQDWDAFNFVKYHNDKKVFNYSNKYSKK